MTRTAVINLFLGLIIGVAAGLVYTWVINPVQYVDVAPDSLREEYKTDYITMIAQAYAGDGNLPLAQSRLATLTADPGQLLAQAIARQTAANAPAHHLQALNALAGALGNSAQP